MEITKIQDRIYEIRSHKVMLDFDLAELYGTETKYLKRSVKQNLKRFPTDFMFELTKNEWESLRCNFSTSNKRGGNRYMPYAFTEQGVAMLSAVLNSDRAIDMNIAIMRAFISLRKAALQYADLAEQVAQIRQTVANHGDQLHLIYDAIENLLDEKIEERSWKEREPIGFKKR